MLYTVKYKKIGSLFWRKIKKCNGDWIMNTLGIPNFPVRHFVDSDNNFYEIPMDSTIFQFSKERPLSANIKNNNTYILKYSTLRSFFWNKIKNVIAETVIFESTNNPIKVVLSQDGTRWEIPIKDIRFFDSKEKISAIEKQTEIDIGSLVHGKK